MIKQLSIALISTIALSACAPAIIVGGAAVGANVVHDRRTTGAVLEDQTIELKAIELRNKDAEIKQRSNISIVSYNQQALMTGQAESDAISRKLEQQIASLPQVRKVYNEVLIGAEGTWGDATSDAYITSKVKLALFDVKLEDFDPTRVKVVTSLDTVYLMGLLTRQEANAVTEKVRYVSGVRKVVSLFEYIPAR